ncbi:MAG: hypothetical protein H0T47_02690, partial [Planctomycetaceae bacterium]|nr:hypothetical protein [Planctomycetaceae bacterium]
SRLALPEAPSATLAKANSPDDPSMDVASAKIVPVRATLDRIEVLEPGTSDGMTLQSARRALPLSRLTPVNRRRAESVLSNLSMFRAMPGVRVEVDHDAYRYFVEHPDVAVSIWRALDVSKCQLWQTGPDSYETDVGDGSTGVIDVLYRSEHDHVVIGEGRFKSPLIPKPIRATGLLHLHTDYVTRSDGQTEAVCRGNLFVTFPSQTVETAAKVVSPVTNMVIDRNFEEISLFAHMMTLAMRTQPGWVESIAGQLDGILERRRTELLQVAARAYVSHKKRELALEGAISSPEAIAPPVRRVTPASR